MTIDEAIKTLTLFDKGQYQGSAVDFRASVKLGNEALKRLQEYRSFVCTPPGFLLPGETEEGG